MLARLEPILQTEGLDWVLVRCGTATVAAASLAAFYAHAKVLLREKASAHCVKVRFHRQRTEFFYWLILDSKGAVVMGPIAKNTREALEGLKEFLPSQRWGVVEFRSTQVSLRNPFSEVWRAVSKPRIVLIGDARNQLKATSVGGVEAGLRGARAAVKGVVGQAP